MSNRRLRVDEWDAAMIEDFTALWLAGVSWRQIARRLDVTDGSISVAVHRFDLPKRPPAVRGPAKPRRFPRRAHTLPPLPSEVARAWC